MTILTMAYTAATNLPAPGSAAYNGLVHEIQLSTDPAKNTGYISVKQGANTLRKFNIGGAAGSNDSVYRIKGGCGNTLDPTQFSISSTVAGEGVFVVYLVE